MTRNPRFRPEVTPEEMLIAGVFGGSYFKSPDQVPRKLLPFVERFGGSPDPKRNAFGVLASLPKSWWEEKGLIKEEHDPLGWFQWYCWYDAGRRIEGYDDWQIDRWRKFVRHKAQLLKALESQPERRRDPTFRPKQRQALLQWAYNPFPEDPGYFYIFLKDSERL